MKVKQVFSDLELAGLEHRLLGETLTPWDIVESIGIVKKKFQAEHQPAWNNGPSPIQDYAYAANHHFGYALFNPPWGIITGEKTFRNETEVRMDVTNLIHLRERGKRIVPGRFTAALKDLWYWLTKPEFHARIIRDVQSQDEYQKLRKDKYGEFFEQMDAFNWEEVHMRYTSSTDVVDRNKGNPFTHLIMYAVASDELVATVRKAEFSYETKGVLHSEDF